jgi:hypothetical protein
MPGCAAVKIADMKEKAKALTMGIGKIALFTVTFLSAVSPRLSIQQMENVSILVGVVFNGLNIE